MVGRTAAELPVERKSSPDGRRDMQVAPRKDSRQCRRASVVRRRRAPGAARADALRRILFLHRRPVGWRLLRLLRHCRRPEMPNPNARNSITATRRSSHALLSTPAEQSELTRMLCRSPACSTLCSWHLAALGQSHPEVRYLPVPRALFGCFWVPF